MKKVVLIALLTLMLSPLSVAFAAEESIPSTPSISSESTPASATENSPTSIDSANNVAALQALGMAQIKERLTRLTALENKTQKSDITAEQKTSLKTDLDNNINGLNALAEKINSEKNLEALRALVKSIYTDFRIIGIVLPRDQGEYAVYRQIGSLGKLTSHEMVLETKIGDWGLQGSDAKRLKALLESSKKHLSAAGVFYAGSLTGLQVLTVASYPAKDKIEKARKDLASGNKELKAGRNDLVNLVARMRIIEKKMKLNQKKNAASGASKSAASQVRDSQTVTYTDSGFSPEVLEVKKGTMVIFKNQSAHSMWVASDPHPVHTNLSEFDSGGGVESGRDYAFTFNKIGKWEYHMHLNSLQKGTITVK